MDLKRIQMLELDLQYMHLNSGYHVTKIIKKTSLNEGVDVDIMGLNLYAPPSVPGFIKCSNQSIADCSAMTQFNHDLQLTGQQLHLMKDVEYFMLEAAAGLYGYRNFFVLLTPLDEFCGGTVSTEDLWPVQFLITVKNFITDKSVTGFD